MSDQAITLGQGPSRYRCLGWQDRACLSYREHLSIEH
jgi:hypothetical protein